MKGRARGPLDPEIPCTKHLLFASWDFTCVISTSHAYPQGWFVTTSLPMWKLRIADSEFELRVIWPQSQCVLRYHSTSRLADVMTSRTEAPGVEAAERGRCCPWRKMGRAMTEITHDGLKRGGQGLLSVQSEGDMVTRIKPQWETQSLREMSQEAEWVLLGKAGLGKTMRLKKWFSFICKVVKFTKSLQPPQSPQTLCLSLWPPWARLSQSVGLLPETLKLLHAVVNLLEHFVS